MEGDLIKPLLLNRIDDYPLSGLGRITTATNQDVHVLINGDYTYTFDMIVTDKLFSKVKEEMIVSTSVSPTSTDFFYVKNIGVKNPGTVTVTCNHITMLTNENYIRGKLTIDGKSVKAIMSEMYSRLDIEQKFTYSTDIDKTIGTTEVVYTNSNPGQILVGETNSLVNILDARLVRKGMTLKLTNKNTGRYIDLRRGKNIAGVSINSSIDNLVTSIVPYYTVKPTETSGTDSTTDSETSITDGWVVKSMKPGATVTVSGEYAVTYNTANVQDKSRALGKDSSWKTDQVRTKGGITQYRVATDMWVDSKDVTLNGETGDVIKSTDPTSADNWTLKEVTGVFTIGKACSEIYDDNNKPIKYRELETGTDWKVNRQRTKDGVVQYQVATGEWVPASAGSFKGQVGDPVYNHAITLPIDKNGWTIRRINKGGVVTTEINGATIYTDADVMVKNRKLAANTDWSTDQIRTRNGVTEYRVGINEWLRSGEVAFSGSTGSIISQPVVSGVRAMARMAMPMMASIAVSSGGWTYRRVGNGKITIGTNGSIYDDEGNLVKNRALANNTVWTVDRIRSQNNANAQYRVGINEWVSYSGNSFTGDLYEVVSQPPKATTGTNDGGWTIKSVTGKVKVTNANGAVIYDNSNPNRVQSNRNLAKNSEWVTTQQRSKNGIVQYKVASDMWVSANDVSLEGSIGGTISTPSINSDDGWTYITVKDGVVTTKSDGATIYGNDNKPVLNRKLSPNTPWFTNMQRNKGGVYQYKVATNMWVDSNDVTFKGQLGSQTSNVATGTATNNTGTGSTEEVTEYGPEVYSPLAKSYKGPHRKYIDYSSRVDNMNDLIDVSNKYFIENPEIDKPTYTIDIDVAKANQKRVVNAEVGDIARIYDPNYGITSDETIIERHFDPDLGINKSLKAGKFQQTIFRYLDKRIKEASQQTKEVKTQADSDISDVKNNIDSVTNDVSEVKDSQVAAKDETDQKIDKAQQESKSFIDQIKKQVGDTQTSLTNFMNSGGNNKIQWLPNFANATQLKIITPYGYWLLDDHGAGFHNNNGTVMNGLSADGRVYADSITGNTLTGTTINGGTINSGYLYSPVIKSALIETTKDIRLLRNEGDSSASTSIGSYGISTPSITVNHLDGVNSISTTYINVDRTATVQYLKVNGNISGNGSGLYLQGPVYVDGRQI